MSRASSIAPSIPPEDERWRFKCDDLKGEWASIRVTTVRSINVKKCQNSKSQKTVQVKHYRERCHRLESHLHSAHNLLKEAAGTLTEDEIDLMDGDAGFAVSYYQKKM